jgi:hypothetical protein
VVAVIGVALVVAAIAGGVGWLPAVKPLVKDTSAGNVATFTVAGATLLLADFTALLAWFTWQSITATRREAKIAEDSLIAIQKQAKIAERQVTATNAQTDVARAQLTASWRPILVERGMEAPSIDIHPSLEEAFTFETDWVNIGRGPAFIRKAFLTLVAGGSPAIAIRPRIAEPGGIVHVVFRLSPSDGLDRSLTQQLTQGSDVKAYVLYHDVGRGAAWRSEASLTKLEKFPTMFDWTLTDAEISEVPASELD